jgi:hypothetical protein
MSTSRTRTIMSFGWFIRSAALALVAAGCIGKDTTTDEQDMTKCVAEGNICTIAGTGATGYNGQGERALDTILNHPNAVTIGADGLVLINDSLNYLVRQLQEDGTLLSIAGSVSPVPAVLEGPALTSGLNVISAFDVGPDGKVFLVESLSMRILELDLSGSEPQLRVVVGAFSEFERADESVWPPVVADFGQLSGIAVSSSGRIYASDVDNGLIWAFEYHEEEVDTGIEEVGSAWMIAGMNADGFANGWFSEPRRMAIHDGDLYVADSDRHAIARVQLDGSGAEWVAGAWYLNGWDCGVDGLCEIDGAAWPGADEGEGNGVLDDFEYDPAGHVPGSGGDGELLSFGPSDAGDTEKTGLDTPHGVSFTPEGRMLIADSGNNAIRAVMPDGTVQTVVGQAPSGYTGDEGPAQTAGLNFPTELVMGADRQVFIADSNNGVVRWIAQPVF